MPQFGCPVDDASVGDTHGLQSEADAEDGHPSRVATHHVDAHACPLGRTGTGGEQDAVEFVHPVVGGEALVVVPPHLDLSADLAEVLNQVVDERVVVVDDEDADHAHIQPRTLSGTNIRVDVPPGDYDGVTEAWPRSTGPR